ncbi:Putative amidase domain-containing protein [Seinonella peptonophila]|uniref:Putative amidase domain-containing protein n=1 Tax=Seinonella peptonophila TaxID=112248 RepID=A0A1M4VHL4_9BACL|nr:amidase domain-containing protein [Seinonella peptonophila]SHE68303.1 Putative amidase domain-containing protein [Seinonella peptonophila]
MEQEALRTLQMWLEKVDQCWLHRGESLEGLEPKCWSDQLHKTQKKRQITPLKAETRVLSLDQTTPKTLLTKIEHHHLYQQQGRVFEEAWQEWIQLVYAKERGLWEIVSLAGEQPLQGKATSQLVQLAIIEPAEKVMISRYRPDEAISYAETYWNTYNSDYLYFSVNDCTNFVSQSLLAGGFPMEFSRNQNRGWWYRRSGKKHTWSYSWAVAHSLYNYLHQKSTGRQLVRQMSSPFELQLGDVICYDWEGDGRWDHNVIITMKDAEGAPLVNAHTNNSRRRYWEYTDSAAWTPQTQYAFFHIVR